MNNISGNFMEQSHFGKDEKTEIIIKDWYNAKLNHYSMCDYYGTTIEFRKWRLSIKGRWAIINFTDNYYFENEEDAVLAKLTWG